jgi:hypothetical protein
MNQLKVLLEMHNFKFKMKVNSTKIHHNQKVSKHLEKKIKTYNLLIKIDNLMKIRNILT